MSNIDPEYNIEQIQNLYQGNNIVHNTVNTDNFTTESSFVNKIWKYYIPAINKIFLVLYLILILIVDLYIIIKNPNLTFFWAIMLFVFSIYYLGCFLVENRGLKKKLEYAHVGNLDYIILILIIFRNIIFLLNFIPGIQLIGILIFFPLLILICIINYLENKKR